MNVVSARFTNPEHTAGILVLEGGPELHGPIPPLSGEYLPAYEAWVEEGNEPDDYAPPEAPPPTVISDRQFSQWLAEHELITWDEHEAWIGPGTVPAAILQAADQIEDELGRRRARSLLIGATSFERGHPTTLQFGGLLGFDEAQLDTIWREAAQL